MTRPRTKFVYMAVTLAALLLYAATAQAQNSMSLSIGGNGWRYSTHRSDYYGSPPHSSWSYHGHGLDLYSSQNPYQSRLDVGYHSRGLSFNWDRTWDNRDRSGYRDDRWRQYDRVPSYREPITVPTPRRVIQPDERLVDVLRAIEAENQRARYGSDSQIFAEQPPANSALALPAVNKWFELSPADEFGIYSIVLLNSSNTDVRYKLYGIDPWGGRGECVKSVVVSREARQLRLSSLSGDYVCEAYAKRTYPGGSDWWPLPDGPFLIDGPLVNPRSRF
jgi:hypothetical protein